MLIHYFTSFKLSMIEVNNRVFQFSNIIEELTFGDLPIFTNRSLLFNLLDRCLLSHSKPLTFHLPHNFPSFFIIKFIKLISLCFPPISFLFFTLFFLLHNDFITNNFFHHDVVQNVTQECVLHLFEFFYYGLFIIIWIYFCFGLFKN